MSERGAVGEREQERPSMPAEESYLNSVGNQKLLEEFKHD